MIIKVCGMREPDNLLALSELPIAWIGLIFYPKSPRAVEQQLADWFRQHKNQFSAFQRVGVFVNAEIDEVLNAVHDFELDLLQLHGEESPEYCELLRRLMGSTSMRKAQLMKVFRVGEGFDFKRVNRFSAHCAYFLFDTLGKNYGGTGQQFNWQLLQYYQGFTPFLLSGGIGPEDVEAVRSFQHPQLYGIDLNSKFETAPGQKDISALRTFIKALGK